MGKKIFLYLLSFISAFLFHEILGAYSPDVHKEITKRVIKQMEGELDKYIKDYTGLVNGIEELTDRKLIREWIEYGSEKEDFSLNPVELLTSHFHNPLTNKGLTEFGVTIGQSAYDRANDPSIPWSWQKARENLYKGLTSATKTEREKALSKSFEALGHLLHLVQDMSVPAHTRDDMHVPYVDGDPYEAYTKNKIGSLNYKADPFLYWNLSVSPYAPKHFWDTDTYNGNNPYSSGYIGLSEYTNANFFSKDTIFKSNSFPHPAKELTNYNDFSSLPITVITTPDNITHETLYIEGYDKKHLAGLTYFADELWNDPNLPLTKKYVLTTHLDNRCHDEYARYLVPRAVGYSVGLLNYFFRGQLDFQYSDTKSDREIEIAISNLSDEPLVKGNFELYYDNNKGERVKLELGPSEVQDLRKESPPFKTTFTPPSNFDPEKKNKYMLVYRGQLGNEKEAIIGKYQLIQKAIPVMASYSYDGAHYTILFKVGKEKPDDPSQHFYIDLADVFGALGHNPEVVYALKVVESRPNFGVLIYFRMKWGMDQIGEYYGLDSGHVIKFKVTTRVQPEQVYSERGEDYKRYDFEYSIDQFDVSDNSIKAYAPVIKVTHSYEGRSADQKTRRHYPYDSLNDNCPMYASWYCAGGLRTGETTGGGAYSSFGNLSFSWSPPGAYCFDWGGSKSAPFTLDWREWAYAKGVEVMGVHRRDLSTGDTTRWIWPIGAGVWLSDLKNGSLENLNWEVKLSAVIRYKYKYISGHHISVSQDTMPCEFYYYAYNENGEWVRFDVHYTWDDAVRGYYGDGGEKELFVYFTCPIIFSVRNSEAMTYEDLQGLLGAEWVFDAWVTSESESGGGAVGQVLPMIGPVLGMSEWSYEQRYVSRNPDTWYERGIRYYPIMCDRPGRYIKAWPVYNAATGTLVGFIYDYTKTNLSAFTTTLSRWVRMPQGATYFVENIPNEIPSHGEVHQMPPLPPYMSPYTFYEMPYVGIDHYPYRHAGGGSGDRLMMRIGSRVELNRSIYIINGQLYDYDQSIPESLMPLDTYPFGRASREMHIAAGQFGIKKIPVVDSTIDGDGGSTLTSKAEGFLDITAGDIEGSPSDVGYLEKEFLSP